MWWTYLKEQTLGLILAFGLCCFIWICCCCYCCCYWTQTGQNLYLLDCIKRVILQNYVCFGKDLLKGAVALLWSTCIKGKGRKIYFLELGQLQCWALELPLSCISQETKCCPRQEKPTFLTDGQMHGKVLFRRKRNATNMLQVVTGTCGMCARVNNWWQDRPN